MTPNPEQFKADSLLAQMSKAQLQQLIDTSAANPICRHKARMECKRRAEGYEQISRFAGIAMIACLGFILLVKLLQ